MESSKHIGNNIAKFRNTQGFSQDDLAKYLGVSRGLISLIESGERTTSVTNLNKLAALFGVDLETLLEEDENIQNIHLAFAFRSNSNTEDLENIAAFKKMVMDYIKIDNLLHATTQS